MKNIVTATILLSLSVSISACAITFPDYAEEIGKSKLTHGGAGTTSSDGGGGSTGSSGDSGGSGGSIASNTVSGSGGTGGSGATGGGGAVTESSSSSSGSGSSSSGWMVECVNDPYSTGCPCNGGVSCSGNDVCVAGICECPATAPTACRSAASGYSRCFNLQTDKTSCGECFNTCPAGNTCVAGHCQP